MTKNSAIIWRIIWLEALLMVFYTANGAFVTITEPSSPILQFAVLIPLAAGIFVYLLWKNKWRDAFFARTITFNARTFLLWAPLLLVLVVILAGNRGLNFDSMTDLIFMFIMQLFVVAFIEETFFRGFMLKMLLAKGVFKAVLITSILFGITHSLQLLGGQSVEATILQILYAFLVGLVLSLLIMHKQSILIAIAFHGLNNFLSFMGREEGHLFSTYVIIAILLAYAIFLWKSLLQRTNRS